MRTSTADVLDLIAEEITEHGADILASFTTWDEGRRKLDGMSRGRRWDIDREQKGWEKWNRADLEHLASRLRWGRWYHQGGGKALFAAYRKRYMAANREKERAWSKAKHERRKQDPKRWATYQARQARHKPKKRARAMARWRANLEANRARQRAHAQASYDRRRKNEGKRRCALCRQPGHNRKRCGRLSPAPPPPPPAPPAPERAGPGSAGRPARLRGRPRR